MIHKKMKLRVGLLLAIFGSSGLSLAGDGPWSSLRQLPQKDSGVRLEQPVSLAIDSENKRYYVVDAGTGQLVSFDKDGQFLAAFTAGGQLKTPVDMVKTLSGSLWVIERSSNELFHIDPRQKDLQRYSPKYPDGTEIFLSRLAIDESHRLYVLDRMKGQVLRLDDNLQVVQTYAGEAHSHGFSDFKIRDNFLWALDGLGHSVAQMSLSGGVVKTIKLDGLQFSSALEVDRLGQLYLLDRHAGTVIVYSQSSEQKFSFLGKGKRAGQLWTGSALLFDWDERLCVVDEGSGRVEILTR